jgi:ssDNA-binding Zn-finger/Zn-ribbon topoisomerase 1
VDYRELGREPDGQVINCLECDAQFTFSAGEQRFFKERQFDTPKRCPSCRERRKKEREEAKAAGCWNRSQSSGM